eukprot:1161789-Pelagomonas_calceolata.AAC.3
MGAEPVLPLHCTAPEQGGPAPPASVLHYHLSTPARIFKALKHITTMQGHAGYVGNCGGDVHAGTVCK